MKKYNCIFGMCMYFFLSGKGVHKRERERESIKRKRWDLHEREKESCSYVKSYQTGFTLF